MGKSAARQSQDLQAQAAKRYTDLATEQYAAAKPAQELSQNYLTGIVQGNNNAYRVAAPEINFMKRQYQNANSAIRDNVAPGGQKNKAYRDLAVSQPGAIAGVFQRKVESALQQLAALGQAGVGNTLNANAGVSQAGNQLGQLAAARGQAVSSAIGSLGGLAGFAFGGGFSGAPKPAASPLSNYVNTVNVSPSSASVPWH